jgi:hypothetical protein
MSSGDSCCPCLSMCSVCFLSDLHETKDHIYVCGCVGGIGLLHTHVYTSGVTAREQASRLNKPKNRPGQYEPCVSGFRSWQALRSDANVFFWTISTSSNQLWSQFVRSALLEDYIGPGLVGAYEGQQHICLARCGKKPKCFSLCDYGLVLHRGREPRGMRRYSHAGLALAVGLRSHGRKP